MLSAFTTALALASCAGVPLMPAGMRDSVNARFEGGFYTLKQSVYFGPFYDDPTLQLMDPRPFHALRYLTLPGGKAISPGASVGIYPAGTRVRVEKVEMPSLGTMVARPNLSPRYNGWVVVRVNRFDVASNGFVDGRHVVVVPLGISDGDELTAWIMEILGDDVETKAWLDQRSPEVRAAIAAKQARVGMLYEELVAALGKPDSVATDAVPEGKRDVAHYGDLDVTLVENVVRQVGVTP